MLFRSVEKEYKSAKLYFDMGTYFGNCTNGGNNYEACIVTAQNALKDYPYSNRREEFASLIMKGKYELAKMSVEKKQLERYQDAEDECYGFINEYPDSKDRALAEKYIEKCKLYEKEHPETALDQLGNNANYKPHPGQMGNEPPGLECGSIASASGGAFGCRAAVPGK